MLQYEQPCVDLLRFLPDQPLTRESRETEQDEEITIGSGPEISEGVEDW